MIWHTAKKVQVEKLKALKAAGNYLKKDTRINIRISSSYQAKSCL